MPAVDVEQPSWLKILFYECLGSILLVFVGLAATVVAVDDSPVPRAFAEGGIYFTAALLLDAFLTVHLNPAFTFGVWIYEAFMRSTAALGLLMLLIMYPIAQYAGALVGVLLTWALSGERTLEGLGAPMLGPGVSDQRGFATEIILSSILVLVFLWSRRLVKDGVLQYFIRAFGLLFVILAMLFIGIPISGANLNPMRYLAVITLAATAPSNWWVWVTGPFIGAAAATAIILFMEWFTLYTSRYVRMVSPAEDLPNDTPMTTTTATATATTAKLYDNDSVLGDAAAITASPQHQQRRRMT